MAPTTRSEGREQEGSPAAATAHSVLLDQDRLGDDLDYFIHLVFCQITKRQKFDMIEKAQHRGLRIKTEILSGWFDDLQQHPSFQDTIASQSNIGIYPLSDFNENNNCNQDVVTSSPGSMHSRSSSNSDNSDISESVRLAASILMSMRSSNNPPPGNTHPSQGRRVASNRVHNQSSSIGSDPTATTRASPALAHPQHPQEVATRSYRFVPSTIPTPSTTANVPSVFANPNEGQHVMMNRDNQNNNVARTADHDDDDKDITRRINDDEYDSSEEVTKLVKQTPHGRVVWNDLAHEHLLVAIYYATNPSDTTWQKIQETLKPFGFSCSIVAFKQHLMKLAKRIQPDASFRGPYRKGSVEPATPNQELKKDDAEDGSPIAVSGRGKRGGRGSRGGRPRGRGGRSTRGQSRTTTSTAGTKRTAEEISDDHDDIVTTSNETASQVTDLDVDAPADEEQPLEYKAPAHLDEDIKSYVNNLMVGQPQYRFRPDSEYPRVENQQAAIYNGPARDRYEHEYGIPPVREASAAPTARAPYGHYGGENWGNPAEQIRPTYGGYLMGNNFVAHRDQPAPRAHGPGTGYYQPTGIDYNQYLSRDYQQPAGYHHHHAAPPPAPTTPAPSPVPAPAYQGAYQQHNNHHYGNNAVNEQHSFTAQLEAPVSHDNWASEATPAPASAAGLASIAQRALAHMEQMEEEK
ncbi:hypothetical protein G7054_g1749 [Neopestalotiopsis clavispora]|nr:hypothetical protein G7054_g1749 [Neopestalotiopsis clavispora]